MAEVNYPMTFPTPPLGRCSVRVWLATALVITATLITLLTMNTDRHIRASFGKPFVIISNGEASGIQLHVRGAPVSASDVVFQLGDHRGTPCKHKKRGFCMDFTGGRRLVISKAVKSPNMTCVSVKWSSARPVDTGLDCWRMRGAHWFGGFEDFRQPWALDKGFTKKLAPFVTDDCFHDNGGFGNVIEPLWVSSAGVGVVVEPEAPLYVSINHHKNMKICLQGRTGPNTPYSHKRAYLRYDVCKAMDITTLWKAMSRKYLPRPGKIISPDVIAKPIWTTWVAYKGFIDQQKVLEFADKITRNNFSISQLEIDDNWTPKYGDLTFHEGKFPNAKDMIDRLTKRGIPTTVWVHPFVNNDSNAFKDLSGAHGLVMNSSKDRPEKTNWWRGNSSGIIDVTSPEGVGRLLASLNKLKDKYGVKSFKFDAGETGWLPQKYALHERLPNPNMYTQRYVALADKSDASGRQEVRVGYRSQNYSMMVRMEDRASKWGRRRGLETLIPCALAFGVMGYPFVLPDMIGGNGDEEGKVDGMAFPDKELFIRWLQASTFMPVMQFSIGPWDYSDPEVTSITQKYVKLHEEHTGLIIKLAKEAVATGSPIIRPLWWTDPTDQTALTLDCEFLLGSDLLVAPVLEKGATSRDIYLPRGQWRDVLKGNRVTGPTWLRHYSVRLDELAYFTRI